MILIIGRIGGSNTHKARVRLSKVLPFVLYTFEKSGMNVKTKQFQMIILIVLNIQKLQHSWIMFIFILGKTTDIYKNKNF